MNACRLHRSSTPASTKTGNTPPHQSPAFLFGTATYSNRLGLAGSTRLSWEPSQCHYTRRKHAFSQQKKKWWARRYQRVRLRCEKKCVLPFGRGRRSLTVGSKTGGGGSVLRLVPERAQRSETRGRRHL